MNYKKKARHIPASSLTSNMPHKFKNFFIALAGAVLIFFVLYAFLVTASTYTMERLKPADAIIVLGAGHGNIARERALAGLRLYEKGWAPVIILTGGLTAYPTSEAAFMAKVINENATDSPKMILEEKSTSTYENLYNVYGLVGDKIKSVIIVSDRFHLFRSLIIAKKVGFQSVRLSSPDPSYLPLWVRVQYYFSEFIKLIHLLPVLLR